MNFSIIETQKITDIKKNQITYQNFQMKAYRFVAYSAVAFSVVAVISVSQIDSILIFCSKVHFF